MSDLINMAERARVDNAGFTEQKLRMAEHTIHAMKEDGMTQARTIRRLKLWIAKAYHRLDDTPESVELRKDCPLDDEEIWT